MPSRLVGAGLTVAVLAACGVERTVSPSLPAGPNGGDLPGHAFLLTFDTRTGQVEVAPPSGARSRADHPSFSLIGGEALEVRADAGGCTPIPANLKSKRCSFTLEVRNRLRATDLATPTSFPRAPQGVSGLLLFPWTTVITGATGVAIPSPDWDRAPANFFNDFEVCSSGPKSDCYRYELVESPLYAGASSGGHRVGYDVPTGTTTMSAYIVVAADLRDNPLRTAKLSPVGDLCGSVDAEGAQLNDRYLYVGVLIEEPISTSFCSFNNTLPRNIVVRGAQLRVFRYNQATAVRVEQVDYGDTLEPDDVALAGGRDFGLVRAEAANFLSENQWVVADVGAAVRTASDEVRPFVQFRLSTTPLDHPATYIGEGFAAFAGTGSGSSLGPELIVSYSLQ